MSESQFQKAVRSMDRSQELAGKFHDAGKRADAQYWLLSGILVGVRELLITAGESEVARGERHLQMLETLYKAMGIETDEENDFDA